MLKDPLNKVRWCGTGRMGFKLRRLPLPLRRIRLPLQRWRPGIAGTRSPSRSCCSRLR
uniref:Uncharacterized protein n=1 Tax=Ciona savignyi TaxID=51511 RepID=H2YS74_CIOSA